MCFLTQCTISLILVSLVGYGPSPWLQPVLIDCLALFRLVELTSGSITVDGVDISQVGLGDVRSGLAIIPQVHHCFLLKDLRTDTSF